MSTDPQLTRVVRSWLEEGVNVMPDRVLDDVLAHLLVTPQRRPWWRAWRKELMSSTLKLGGAVAAGLGVAVVALAVIFSQPSQPPATTPSPTPVSSPTATPEATPTPGGVINATPGLVAYTTIQLTDPLPETCIPSTNHPWCHESRIWVANSDGSGARELLPDVPGNQSAIAWTPDGTELLYAEDRGLALTSSSGDQQQIVTATQCPEGAVTNCPNLGGNLSPDGTRLAYTVYLGNQANASVVAIFDLATRQITLLESTRTTGLNRTCRDAARQGDNGSPLWSPDGTRLVVTRDGIGPLDDAGNCQSTVYSVAADGTDFAVLLRGDGTHEPSSAGWSPGGAQLLVNWVYSDPNGGPGFTCDIGVARPDGSGFRQLTADGISCNARWMPNGRILFEKLVDLDIGAFDVWLMDADGTNATLVSDRSIGGMTAIGCAVCAAPPGTNWSDVLWQPIP